MILSDNWIYKFYELDHNDTNYFLGIFTFQAITLMVGFALYSNYLDGDTFPNDALFNIAVYFGKYWPYLILSYVIGDICMIKAGSGYKNKNYDAVRFYGVLSVLFSTVGILFAVYVPILFLDMCFGLYSIILAIFRKFIKWVNTEPKQKDKPSSKNTIKCYDDLLKNKKRYY